LNTLLEILDKSEAHLRGKGVVEARLDAEHLLADTLQCKRMDLYLQFDKPLQEETLALLRPKLVRRGRHEPLSHILGHHPFHGLKLTVSPSALIPRPETEELVEKTAGHLKSAPNRILDLGTGTGAIALWMKQTYPNAEVVATDRSEEALSLAKKNGLDLNTSVAWISSDWFSSVEGTYDLIISNPPYLTEQEWQEAAPEVRDYEPKEALFASANGLADLRIILTESISYLNPKGLIALETGINQREELKAIATESGFSDAWGEEDFHRRSRYFFAIK